MIARYVLHIEFHWGYVPRISLRRAPQPGDMTPWGMLVRCEECSGDGFLAIDQDMPASVYPSDAGAATKELWLDEG